MKILTYKNCQIQVIRQTKNPNQLVALATNLTQKEKIETIQQASPKLIKYLLKANHTSIFEHASITVLISNVSRAFLAQITRHRIGSFTSASQHYQDYRDYPVIVSDEMASSITVKKLFEKINTHYESLIDMGIKPEEARQILPNAKAVNILWTVNARSLINFLNLRLCKRNTKEMLNFARFMKYIAGLWWPDLFSLVGPDCVMKGHCTQGKMKAEVCHEN